MECQKKPQCHVSTKVECKALANTTGELMRIEGLLNELDVKLKENPCMWCFSAVFHARTKHIEIDYHFVMEGGLPTTV
jgi:hypothetical protein